MGLSMTLYKVLCDDHTCCLDIRQDHTSMSSWVSDHGRCNRKVRVIGKRIVIANKVLDECVDSPKSIVEFEI